MRDYKKFCRPRTTKHPKVGDIKVKLNCGEFIFVKATEFKKVKQNFKHYSIVGSKESKPGRIRVYDSEIDDEFIIDVSDYSTQFDLREIIGEIESGSVVSHNTILNRDAKFSQEDFITLDDSWEFSSIVGVSIYNKQSAVVGDVAIKYKDKVLFTNPSDWDSVKTIFEAVGLVGIESRNMSDGRVRILSLDYMDYNTPTTGNQDYGIHMYWGASGDISGLSNKGQVPCMSTSTDKVLTSDVQRAIDYAYEPTDYFTGTVSANSKYKYRNDIEGNTSNEGRYCPNAYLDDGTINPQFIATTGTIPGTSTQFSINNANTDFDGEGNTLKIMSKVTVSTPVNNYSAGNYPAAHCCHLYNKGGLNWYWPASGEMALIIANMEKMSSSRNVIYGKGYKQTSYWYWTSTPHNSSDARTVSGNNGNCYSNPRSYSNANNRVLAVSAI